MDTRRAFIAPVAEPLNGTWHDLSDYADCEALEVAAKAAMRLTHANNYGEELDCSDVEGFGSLFTGHHYISVADAWRAHEWLSDAERAFGSADGADIALAFIDCTGDTITRLPDMDTIRDGYHGTYDNDEAMAEDYADETGMLEGVPDSVRQYFDWPAFTRDLMLDTFVEENGHYFWR